MSGHRETSPLRQKSPSTVPLFNPDKMEKSIAGNGIAK
jgi:Ca2+-binding EF-hand superfamily protein